MSPPEPPVCFEGGGEVGGGGGGTLLEVRFVRVGGLGCTWGEQHRTHSVVCSWRGGRERSGGVVWSVEEMLDDVLIYSHDQWYQWSMTSLYIPSSYPESVKLTSWKICRNIT